MISTALQPLQPQISIVAFVWHGDFQDEKHVAYFHVSVPNIYGTSSSICLIIFLKVISKVLYFNITQKFTNILVQLPIFLIYLLVGTFSRQVEQPCQAGGLCNPKSTTINKGAVLEDKLRLLTKTPCHHDPESVAWTNRVIYPGIYNVSNGFTVI